jgi:predicted XRE-type DNA-binding protein
MRTKRRPTYDVLADLGLPDAADLRTKAILAKRLNEVIAERRLTQQAAARVLGMSQPKVSAIKHYRLRGVSLERLLRALTTMGQNVDIVVRPKRTSRPARIAVAA